MQLNLFEDNRPGILNNIAYEYICSRDLDQAVSVYEQLLVDYPDDKRTYAQLKLVSEWRDLLSGVSECPDVPAYLQTLWLQLEPLSHPALRSLVLETLIAALRTLPNPEQIYLSPRFHLGHILMDAGQYAEAAGCFHGALSFDGIERGRFLGWKGDALTLAGSNEALNSYLDAFLDDPLTVDMKSIKNRKITDLHTSLQSDAMDEIDEFEEPAWLPVWGWLQGIFTLPLQTVAGDIPSRSEEFEAQLAEEHNSAPHIWFHMLIYAEKLRVGHWDSRELGAVRRLMKRTNGFMFNCYLEKIIGRR